MTAFLKGSGFRALLRLDKSSKTPLYEQIYKQIIERIIDGIYAPGTRLSSIRDLAGSLQCSCNTVSAAYKLLIQEGFAVSQPGSGFYITDDGLFLERVKLERRSIDALGTQDDGSIEKNRARLKSKKADNANVSPVIFDFTYRNLEPGSFPQLEWKALNDDVLLSPIAVSCNRYTDSEGEFHLREAIARHLAVSRDIHCRPEQIIIQDGTQPALQNLLMLFDDKDDSVAMENPGYTGARLVFERCGFDTIPCPVIDDEIWFVDAVKGSDARLVYTTPSNQFPMGSVMSEEERRRLLRWACKADAYIIEDDYCYELNYRNKVQPALRTLDEHDRVIYMGTFSKSLSPALRINFMILPDALLRKWRSCFDEAYSAVNWLTQEVLARYLESDRYSRHIRRILLRNKRKYETLKDALAACMGNRVNVMEGGSGLHMLVEANNGVPQEELIALARSVGVAVYDTDKYWMTHPHPMNSCVLIGFSAIEEQLIRPGIERLAQVWFDDQG